MASSTEYSRKILNSPAYAEPCLVHAAKKVLLAENWYASFDFPASIISLPNRVFLTGKEHVDYRRSLNALFTRKAMGLAILTYSTRQFPENFYT